jgi:hypothetical protein
MSADEAMSDNAAVGGDEWRGMWTRPYVPPVESVALSPLVQVNQISRALAEAISPPQVIEIEAKIAALENYMRDAGLYSTEEIRPVNEARMRARWRLGQLLAEIERGPPGPTPKDKGGSRPYLKTHLREIGLAATAAKEAQRIAALPESEFAKALARARERDTLTYFAELIALAHLQGRGCRSNRRLSAHPDAHAYAVRFDRRCRVCLPERFAQGDCGWPVSSSAEEGAPMTRITASTLIALIILLSTGTSHAVQTKDQCARLGVLLGGIIPVLVKTEKFIIEGGVTPVLPYLGGPLLAAATLMSQKEQELVAALQNYRIATEGTGRAAQLCAR